VENRRRAAFLITPPALWILVLFLVPLGIMVVYTFQAGTFSPEREIFTFDNYREYFTNPAFQRVLLSSSVLAFNTALLSVLLAYPLAYFLVFRAGRSKLMLLTLLILPAWTSYLLRILAWRLIFNSSGPLNSLLSLLGIVDQSTPVFLYSRAAVLITLVYVWIPFAALPIFSALERIDKRLLEAAADLGSPGWLTFLRITLPLSMPGVIASFFFVFIPTLGEWVTPSLVGGVKGVMYGNLIQDQFVRALNWPMGALMSLVMLVMVLVFTYTFTRMVRVTDISGL
jgi:spermidine/putrescine transport system permease protein